MTKKTNALILRYGVSAFWKNKCVDSSNSLKLLLLEKVTTVELLKKNLDVLKFNLFSHCIILYVFSTQVFGIRFIERVVKYYDKILNLQSVIQKYGLFGSLILNMLNVIGHKHIVLFNTKYTGCVRLATMLVVKKKGLVILCCKFVFFIKYYGFIKNLYLQKFFFLCRKAVCCWERGITKTVRRSRVLLKTVVGQAVFKLISIQLANILYFCGIPIAIVIKNALCVRGHIVTIIVKKFKHQTFRTFFYKLLLAVVYNSSKSLSDYLAVSLKTARNHFRVLKNFTESVELYFISTTYKIIGIQLWVSGKLGGKMRKSKYSYTLGVVHMQTIKTPLSYNISLCYTKFGVLSVKVWLFNVHTAI